MKSRILSFMVAMILAVSNTCFVAAKEEKEEIPIAPPCPVGDTVLAESNFNEGDASEFELNGTGIKIDYAPDGERCVKMPLDTGHQIGKMYDEPFEPGVYSFSFDFYAEEYVTEIVLRLYNEEAKNFGDVPNMAMLSRFIADGEKFIIYRNSKYSFTDHELWYKAEKNKWHSMSVWIDTINGEMAYYINGEHWATMPLHDKVISPKGFAIVHNAGSKSERFWYFDNLKICRENSMYSGGLSPVFVDYKTEENIISNNFFKDMPPEFDLTMKNRTGADIEAEHYYKISTFEGVPVYTSESEQITIPEDEVLEKNITPNVEYYNRMYLDSVLKIDGKEYVKRIMYSYSNRATTDPMNYWLGAQNHLYQNKGVPDVNIPIMGRAGIGNVRDQLGSWHTAVDDNALRFFELCEEYGIRIMLTTSNAPKSMQEGDSRFVGEHHMKEFQDAIKEWAREYGDNIYALEVNNEPHNPIMTGQYHARFDVQADWLRYAYRGIQASGKDIKVVGICEDNAGFNYKPSTNYYEGTPYGDYNGYVEGILDWLDGEQAMDVISIHVYPPSAEDKKGYSLEKQARELLKEADLDPDIPVWITESGFSEYNFNYDHRLVAAQAIRKMLRWQTDELCEVFFWFHTMDRMEDSTTLEGYWGLVEDTRDGEAEVPGLGKMTYVAVSYFNSLAADMKAGSVTDIDNKFLIQFEHRDGHDVIATGITDDNEETVGIYLGCDSATMSDMCGNEKTIYGIDGVFTLQLKENEITYLQGNFAEPELTEPKFNLENPVYTVPVDYSYDYTVLTPDDFRGSVEATAYGVELTKPVAEAADGKASVELTTEELAQDNARIELKIKSGDKTYYYRDNEIVYSASGVVDTGSIKWRPSGEREDLWNLSFDLKNVRTDIPISGKMYVEELDKTYELPMIAQGTSRKITIPMNPISKLIELGKANLSFDFAENDAIDLKLDSNMAVAKWTDTPPTIDGVIEEGEYTSDAMSLSLDDSKYIFGGTSWRGPDDCSYKAYLTYDNDYLYVGVKVRDDIFDFSQAKIVEESWKNDSIQVLMGLNPGVTGTMYTIAVMDGKETVYRYYHENNILGLGGSDAKCVFTDAPFKYSQSGTEAVYEIAMPWSGIRLGHTDGIRQGQSVFFDINYNDTDGNGRRFWMDYTNAIGGNKCENDVAIELVLLPKN